MRSRCLRVIKKCLIALESQHNVSIIQQEHLAPGYSHTYWYADPHRPPLQSVLQNIAEYQHTKLISRRTQHISTNEGRIGLMAPEGGFAPDRATVNMLRHLYLAKISTLQPYLCSK